MTAVSAAWIGPPPSPSLQHGMMTEQDTTRAPCRLPHSMARTNDVGVVRFPVGEEQFGVRGQGVNDLAAA